MRGRPKKIMKLLDYLDAIQLKITILAKLEEIGVDDDKLVEKKEEFKPFNYTLFLNFDVEKEYKSENVVKNVALELSNFNLIQNTFL